jgi:Ca2+-binding RTX toxin-like protein
MKTTQNHTFAAVEPVEPRRLLAVDLAVTGMSFDPQILAPGDPVVAQVTLQNAGNEPTVLPFQYRLLLTRDTTLGNGDDVNLGTLTYSTSINALTNRTLEVSRTVPNGTAAGAYRLAIVLDTLNVFGEPDELNNTGIAANANATVGTVFTGTSINGTAGKDVIELSQNKTTGRVIVLLNGQAFLRGTSGLSKLTIDAGSGDDKVFCADPDNFDIDLGVTGAGGNDTIIGGAGDDELSGANGKDKVFGNKGDDYLLGGASSDRLYGGIGDDTLSGAGGNDFLYADSGENSLLGGAGNDKFFSFNGSQDTLSGNDGVDTAQADAFDVLAGIEGSI